MSKKQGDGVFGDMSAIPLQSLNRSQRQKIIQSLRTWVGSQNKLTLDVKLAQEMSGIDSAALHTIIKIIGDDKKLRNYFIEIGDNKADALLRKIRTALNSDKDTAIPAGKKTNPIQKISALEDTTSPAEEFPPAPAISRRDITKLIRKLRNIEIMTEQIRGYLSSTDEVASGIHDGSHTPFQDIPPVLGRLFTAIQGLENDAGTGAAYGAFLDAMTGLNRVCEKDASTARQVNLLESLNALRDNIQNTLDEISGNEAAGTPMRRF